MTEPFASLCFLSFDRPDFIKRAIVTAVEGTAVPTEVIVHDDGSNLETKTVLRELLAEGLISTLIENPVGHNQGQGIALNRMFQMAKGDPICKLDHDLIFYPGWLDRCVEILDGNWQDPTVPLIGCMGLFRYMHPPVEASKMFIKSWPGGWDEVADFVGSGMVIPRRAWLDFGPFEERSTAFAEDYAFKMKVAASDRYVNALTQDTLADNQGFGLGPSTVVVPDGQGGVTSREIKQLPFLVSGGMSDAPEAGTD